MLCLGLTLPAAAASVTVYGPPEYTAVSVFSEGLLAVYDSRSQWGYIDEAGKLVIPHQYHRAGDFSHGLAVVQNDLGESSVIDKTGTQLFPFARRDMQILSETRILVSDRGTWGIIDKAGAEIVPIRYGEIKILSNGLARVLENQKYGLIDATGKELVPCKYRKLEDFSDGLALVYNSAEARYGYVDQTGAEVLPCKYDDAKDFENGYAAVKSSGRWTIIDKTGKDLIPQQYTYRPGGPDSDRSAAAGAVWVYLNSGALLIDSTGRELTSAGQYIPTTEKFSEGLTVAGKDQKCGVLNASGKEVVPCQYGRIYDFSGGYARTITSDGKQGFLDKAGKFVQVEQNVNLGDFSEGFAHVSSSAGGKTRYGFISGSGQMITEFKYAHVQDFSNGYAVVVNFDNQYGMIDTTGKEVIPCAYQAILDAEDGYARFSTGKDASLNKTYGLFVFSGSAAPAAPETSAAPAVPAAPKEVSAAPTSSTVLVNGKQVAFDAYNINDNNYFKLRDLAYILNGTEKQFEVSWDEAAQTIVLTSGKGYTAVGGEMAAKGAGIQKATVSASRLLVDGQELSFTAYTIGGNNFFKLRDIGQAFDFGVNWDDASQTIVIDTSIGYTAG